MYILYTQYILFVQEMVGLDLKLIRKELLFNIYPGVQNFPHSLFLYFSAQGYLQLTVNQVLLATMEYQKIERTRMQNNITIF